MPGTLHHVQSITSACKLLSHNSTRCGCHVVQASKHVRQPRFLWCMARSEVLQLLLSVLHETETAGSDAWQDLRACSELDAALLFVVQADEDGAAIWVVLVPGAGCC